MILLYIAMGGFIAHRIRINGSRRSSLLWKPTVLNILLFPAILLSLFSTQPQTLLNTASWGVYSLIISYVVAIEVPGYLMLSKYDDRHGRNLMTLRRKLMKLGYAFETLEDLKSSVEENSSILAEESIKDLLDDFVSFCERISNLDRSLWQLALNEITNTIERLSQRSKHPSPKLIDILSLAGLSFLLSQVIEAII